MAKPKKIEEPKPSLGAWTTVVIRENGGKSFEQVTHRDIYVNTLCLGKVLPEGSNSIPLAGRWIANFQGTQRPLRRGATLEEARAEAMEWAIECLEGEDPETHDAHNLVLYTDLGDAYHTARRCAEESKAYGFAARFALKEQEYKQAAEAIRANVFNRVSKRQRRT